MQQQPARLVLASEPGQQVGLRRHVFQVTGLQPYGLVPVVEGRVILLQRGLVGSTGSIADGRVGLCVEFETFGEEIMKLLKKK